MDLVLQPRGVDKVHIVYGGGMAPEYIDDPRSAILYRGLKSDLATGGHLCYLERPNYEFGQYLSREVAT